MSPEQAKKIARAKLIALHPELAQSFAMQDLKDSLEGNNTKQIDAKMEELRMQLLIEKMKSKGEKGDPGYTPLKGIDYMTEEEINQMIDGLKEEVTPVKGVDYFDGEDGESIVGPQGPEGKPGKTITGPPGTNGSPDSPEDIAYKLNMLEDALDYKVLKNVPDFSKDFKAINEKIDNQPAKGKLDQRWHGGGLNKVYHDTTLTGDGTVTNPLSVVSATSGIDILSITTGINAKTVGTTNLYTVPVGKTAIITGIDILVTAATAVTVPPTVGVGIASGEDDIFFPTSLIGLNLVNEIYRGVPLGVFVKGNAGEIVKLGIDVGATATTMTITVNLIGYLI